MHHEAGNSSWDFTFPVATVDRGLMEGPDRHLLLKPRVASLFDDGLSNRFDSFWPNLVDAARGREDLDFGTLAPQIYSEASKGDEAFETLGIKFPAELVTKYGLVPLVGIQLYLLLYLKRLSGSPAPDDPGWNIPWMGVDQSFLGRAMTFATVYVLPCAASLAIVVRSIKAIRPGDSGRPRAEWMSLFIY